MFKPCLTASLAALLLAGCDSGLAYRADLGQRDAAQVPTTTLTETSNVTATGQSLSLSFTRPAVWQSVSSVKVIVNNIAYPLSATGSNLVTAIPNTAPLRPMNSNQATMSFVLDNDHVAVAQVTFQ